MGFQRIIDGAETVALAALVLLLAVSVLCVLAGYLWTIGRSCWVLTRVYLLRRRS